MNSKSSLVRDIRRGLSLMTSRERRMAVMLVFTSLLNGGLQTMAIVAIVPMIQLMLTPAGAFKSPLMSWIQPFLAENRTAFLLQIAAGIGLLVLLKTIFAWLQLGWMSRFSSGCEVRLSALLMNRILVAPYLWLVQQNSAKLRQLLFSFVAVWSRDFLRSLLKLINDIVFAIFIVGVLIWANPASGLLITCGIGLTGALLFAMIRPRLYRLAQAKRQGIFGANRVSTDAVLGVKDVKMAGAEDRFVRLFDEQVKIYSSADAKAQQWTQVPRILLEAIAYLSLVALGGVVALSDSPDPELGGLLLLYGLSAVRLLPIFSTLVSSLTLLVGALPLIADLQQLIEDTRTAELPPSHTGPTDWRKVQVKNVSMRYEGASRPALSDISLTIERGKAYGIVGPSGAGKSTFIDVVAGLLSASSGAIYLDDQELTREHQRAWRHRFGYVAQRPFLLDASLRENILFSSTANADEAKLQRAVSLARLDQVVARLPGGLDGRVGEQGALLSGGEQQRVAIARALYRGAELLILDEVTSSLDVLVEREIADSIATLRGEVTTLLVSHRLDLVRNCDEIWVFENGRLSARGNHESLLQDSILYFRMVS